MSFYFSVAVTVQITLSINRPDLARREFERAKKWAEDDVLLQLIESSIALATGKDGYSDPSSFYTEQLANPSLTSPHLLTARGVTRLLKGEISGAKSDFEEAVSQQGGKPDAETLAAMTVVAGLGTAKQTDVDQYWRYVAPPVSLCTICSRLYSQRADKPAPHPPTCDRCSEEGSCFRRAGIQVRSTTTRCACLELFDIQCRIHPLLRSMSWACWNSMSSAGA